MYLKNYLQNYLRAFYILNVRSHHRIFTNQLSVLGCHPKLHNGKASFK